MGYKPVIYDSPQKLRGYKGDLRIQKAEIIIPKSQISRASNDIGFNRGKNGKYTLYISEYDESIAETGRGFVLNNLKKTYAKNKIIKEVSKTSKYKLKTIEGVNNKIKIKIELK